MSVFCLIKKSSLGEHCWSVDLGTFIPPPGYHAFLGGGPAKSMTMKLEPPTLVIILVAIYFSVVTGIR